MKKIIILLFFPLCIGHAALTQGFFLRTDAWPEPRAIQVDTIEKRLTHATENPQNITLKTKSGLEVPAFFYNRNSNVAVIAGPALPAPKESMDIYARLFDKYDVISIDYRWVNNYFSSLIKSIILCSPVQRMLLDEEEEIYAALAYLKNHKDYEKIIGLGECYSNFLLTKIQADETQKSGKGPFTHLILDSCWHSLTSFAQSICDDPCLPISPQVGGAPWIIKKITGCPLVKWPLLKIIFTFLQNVSIEEHLAKLDIPVLFIYGLNDLFVPKAQFESIWQSANKGKRAALLTPYRHSDNLHNKPVYRYVCEEFVNAKSISTFQENCKEIL